MTMGRVLIAWMAAGFWLAGGLLLSAAGYVIDFFAVAGLASVAMALLVAAAPLRPVLMVSVGLALLCVGLTTALVVIGASVLAGAAALAYLAAAFFSSGAGRYASDGSAQQAEVRPS